MINDNTLIDTLDELEVFLNKVDRGTLALNNVAGVALARNNSDGRPFVAVLDDKHQLLLGRWVTEEVFEKGKEIVRRGPAQKH